MNAPSQIFHRLALLLLVFCATRVGAVEVPDQRVGLPLIIEDQYLPGPLLEVVPRRDREPSLIVRILETKPGKDGFRYTFEVQGLDAGTHNLGEFLRDANAESGHSEHNVPVTITTELPPGLPRPSELAPKPVPGIGGYRTLVKVLIAVWVVGLLVLINSFRKKKPVLEAEAAPVTLADRLKPLIQKASREPLTTNDQARLERLLVGHWREKLPEVQGLTPVETLRHLRQHPEASPLILKLEHWLHAPGSQVEPDALEQLLAPYRS
ncbi:hypothetical protein V2O64_22270 [Verrucomicrobiaceae bacterium 227]